MEVRMDEAIAKKTLRLFSYGLYVATTTNQGGGTGAMLVNWVGQVSFEPRMLSLSVENTAHFLDVIRESGVFAINVLESGQREFAGHFGKSTAKVGDKLVGYEWRAGSTGSPLLAEALGSIECRVIMEHPAGDHVLFLGEVVDAHYNRDGEPITMREAGFKYSG
jgi:flavin reductase (DIM6/NTAB) family NADH-FMN oxidoreductase RutF